MVFALYEATTAPSLAVSSLLRHYLSCLGLPSHIVFGVLLWDSAAREGPQVSHSNRAAKIVLNN